MENSRKEVGLECMELINLDAYCCPVGAINVQELWGETPGEKTGI